LGRFAKPPHFWYNRIILIERVIVLKKITKPKKIKTVYVNKIVKGLHTISEMEWKTVPIVEISKLVREFGIGFSYENDWNWKLESNKEEIKINLVEMATDSPLNGLIHLSWIKDMDMKTYNF